MAEKIIPIAGSAQHQRGLPAADATLHSDATKLRVKLDHLDALLLMSYGEPGETMNERMLPHVRDDYLAACHALALECKALAEELEEATGVRHV